MGDMHKRVAVRLLQAMAYDRNDFVNKIEHHLVGAIAEFYKSTLAKKNGQTDLIYHWMTEVDRLINMEMPREIRHNIRGFRDRRKAFETAISEVQSNDKSHRKYAEGQVKKDFKLPKLQHMLNDSDTEAFWVAVREAAEMSLASFE